MHFGLLGDIHGDFDTLKAIIERHPEVAFWLSVGDVAGDGLRYPQPVAPLYWIQGNNEDFNLIAGLKPCATDEDPAPARDGTGLLPTGSGTGLRPAGSGTGLQPCEHANLRFLPNGSCTDIAGLNVGALGGTFAPTWYETAAAELPYPGNPKGSSDRKAATVRDDKRRHFVHEQVEALKTAVHVDVLLTHEAARPFFVQAGARRLDAGKTPVNELLSALRPRLHFFGHHHRFADAVRSGVRSIGLDLMTRSYVLVDRETFEITKIDYH